MTKKYKAIICDFDQTLIKFNVNWDLLRQEFVEIFKKYGFEVNHISLHPLFEKVADKLKLLEDSGNSDKTIKAILNDIVRAQETFESNSLNSIILYPDTKRFLKNVSDKSLKLGLLTSNTSLAANKIFSKFKISFNGSIVGREEVKYPKPNLEGIKKLLKKLKVSGDSCILIGDADSDVEVANKIGALSVFLKRDKNQYLSHTKPNLIINSLSEIIL